MGLNFPSSPAINDLYPVPAVPGLPQYKWDGTVWLANAGGGAAGGDFVPIAGGVMTGELINKIGLGVIAAGQSGAYLSILKPPAAAGANTVEGGVGEQTDWSDYQARWQIMLGDTKDAAGNTGNNFAVFRFDNTGLPLGKPLAIDRATGQVLLANDPTQPLSVATKQYVDTKVAAVPAGGRPQLTGARSWYIRTDGNDTNDGSANTAGSAFKTIQRAWDELCKYDCNGFAVNLVCGAGMTFTAGLTTSNTVAPVNGFNITLDGGGSTIQTSFGPCVFHTAANVGLWIYNAILRPGIGGDCVSVSGRGVRCTIAGNITFGPAGSGASHVKVSNGAYCNLSNAYTVTGAATYHFNVGRQSMLEVNGVTVTLTASLAFNTFAICDQLSLLIATTMTYTNGASITGIKHNIAANSVVYTGGSAFPGGTAGIVSTGGQYS